MRYQLFCINPETDERTLYSMDDDLEWIFEEANCLSEDEELTVVVDIARNMETFDGSDWHDCK